MLVGAAWRMMWGQGSPVSDSISAYTVHEAGDRFESGLGKGGQGARVRPGQEKSVRVARPESSGAQRELRMVGRRKGAGHLLFLIVRALAALVRQSRSFHGPFLCFRFWEPWRRAGPMQLGSLGSPSRLAAESSARLLCLPAELVRPCHIPTRWRSKELNWRLAACDH